MPKKRTSRKIGTLAADAVEDQSLKGGSSDCDSSVDLKNDAQSDSVLSRVTIAVDSLTERPDVRVKAYGQLMSDFRMYFLGLPNLGERWNYYEMFISSVESSMKRGKTTEQVYAAEVLSSFTLQVSPLENREILTRFQNFFEVIINDNTQQRPFRTACVKALSWLHFLSEPKDYPNIKSCMQILVGIFSASCLKGDGKPPTLSTEEVSLHQGCVQSWTLLFCCLHSSEAPSIGENSLGTFSSLLNSNYLVIRLAACDAIGLIFEVIREVSKTNFKGSYYRSIIEILNKSVHCSNKSTSKIDSKKQRSTFRNLLAFLESHLPPEGQVVKLKGEKVELDTFYWVFIYDSFCRLLAQGVSNHLRENNFLRSHFDLGPAVVEHTRLLGVAKTEWQKSERIAHRNAEKVRSQHRKNQRNMRFEDDED